MANMKQPVYAFMANMTSFLVTFTALGRAYIYTNTTNLYFIYPIYTLFFIRTIL